MRVGVVSGLKRETECLIIDNKIPDDLMVSYGIGPELASAGAKQLIFKGADALVSFGIAGGTAPHIKVGTLVLATEVLTGVDRIKTTHKWLDALAALVTDALVIAEGPIAGVDRIASSPILKTQLNTELGAIACDMESHAIGSVAKKYGIPFIVIRVVSDHCHREVPSWLLGCINSDGRVKYGELTAALARRPWCIVNLLSLACETRRAFRVLCRVARLAGPSLGFTQNP